ncbi:MAG: hypothetical protein ABMA02_15755, partial [Saprospiraceae bacterium]
FIEWVNNQKPSNPKPSNLTKAKVCCRPGNTLNGLTLRRFLKQGFFKHNNTIYEKQRIASFCRIPASVGSLQ